MGERWVRIRYWVDRGDLREAEGSESAVPITRCIRNLGHAFGHSGLEVTKGPCLASLVLVPYSAITSNMATNIFAEILQWSALQPLWQRDALRRLFAVGTLTSTDLDALTEICKSAHGLAPGSKKAVPVSAQHLPVGGPVAATAVILVDLTHHTGVNALAPEQTVSFGPNLTIVYGENATGKSGLSGEVSEPLTAHYPHGSDEAHSASEKRNQNEEKNFAKVSLDGVRAICVGVTGVRGLGADHS